MSCPNSFDGSLGRVASFAYSVHLCAWCLNVTLARLLGWLAVICCNLLTLLILLFFCVMCDQRFSCTVILLLQLLLTMLLIAVVCTGGVSM